MDRTYSKNDQAVLLRLLELSETTNSVEVSLGYTSESGHCCKGIVIKKAAPAIVKAVVNDPLVFLADMMRDGLHITTYPDGKETQG